MVRISTQRRMGFAGLLAGFPSPQLMMRGEEEQIPAPLIAKLLLGGIWAAGRPAQAPCVTPGTAFPCHLPGGDSQPGLMR